MSGKTAQQIAHLKNLEPIPAHALDHKELLAFWGAVFATCAKALSAPETIGQLMTQASHNLEELRREEFKALALPKVSLK